MKKIFVAIFLCLALAAPATAAQDNEIQQFLRSPKNVQNSYLVGFIDCFILYSAEVGFSFPPDVTKGQVVEAIKKYINENQNEWGRGLPALCVTAIARSFPQKQ